MIQGLNIVKFMSGRTYFKYYCLPLIKEDLHFNSLEIRESAREEITHNFHKIF